MPDTIPPGYKKTEIGTIPEDWEVKRLGEVFEIKRGASPRPINKYVSKKGINWIKISDVEPDGKYLTKTEVKITKDGAEKSVLVHPNDLLLSNSMSYGRPYISKIIGCIHDGWLLLKPKVKSDIEFIYYLLRTDKIQKEFNLMAAGSGVNNLKIDSVSRVYMQLPPLPEQRAIARILSDIDELIESIDKLIEKKKLIKKGAMQQLLTGKKRLPGFKGEWVRKRLGEILKYEQPTRYIVKNTNYLEVGFIPVLTAGKTFILGYTDEKDGIYNDVPAIIFDDFTTAIKYVNFPFKVKSSAMKILKCRNEEYDLKFIYEKMQMIDYQISEGDHKRRWIAEYQNIEIILPPTLAEQKAIAQILSDMDEEIEALERKKQKYEMIKKGMMELLLTGKVRVKEENGEIKRIGERREIDNE